jgi:hypothetical protein
MAAAVAQQQDYDYTSRVADQTDILIAGLVLAAATRPGGSRIIESSQVKPFARLGLRAEECRAMLAVTARHIGALRGALGC